LALNNNNNNKLYTVDRNKTAFTIDFVRDNLRFQAQIQNNTLKNKTIIPGDHYDVSWLTMLDLLSEQSSQTGNHTNIWP
jgi:hypothetical protein